MTSSRRVEAILACVLAVSLAGKLAANRVSPAPDPDFLASRLSAVIAAAGFEVHSRTDLLGSVAVSARRGRCALWALEASPHATSAAAIAREAESVGSLTYLYGGTVSEQPPKATPLFAYYWWRELGRIGLTVPRRPVIARAASPSCDLSRIAWAELATVER